MLAKLLTRSGQEESGDWREVGTHPRNNYECEAIQDQVSSNSRTLSWVRAFSLGRAVYYSRPLVLVMSTPVNMDQELVTPRFSKSSALFAVIFCYCPYLWVDAAHSHDGENGSQASRTASSVTIS